MYKIDLYLISYYFNNLNFYNDRLFNFESNKINLTSFGDIFESYDFSNF